MSDFTIFNTPHLVVLILTALISVAFVIIGRRYPTSQKTLSLILVVLIVVTTVAAAADKYVNGYLSIENHLPMHLCDWVIVFVLVTFITKSIYSYEVAYFWGLGGTLQALITPDIVLNYPSRAFIIFFVNHSSIIISIIYFTFVFRLRPYLPSIKRTFLWSQVYFVSAFTVNLILGTNYGFLMEKPGQGSLIDYLGPWPYYLISLEIMALISFFIYYSPFWIKDKFFRNS